MDSKQPFSPVRGFQLGSLSFDAPVFLAPMAGVTDRPFRMMVKSFGTALMFSEMIASEAQVRESRKTLQMLSRTPEEEPLAVQLAGCDPAVLAEAARQNEQAGAPLIDINFGCPVKKIVNGHAGSALMKDESLAGRIMEAVVRAVSVPVSVKMRLGWSYECLNAPNLARIAQESGVQMITVHGRTRSQFYEGTANWNLIRDVKNAVQLPVIVNGDIKSAADARAALTASGADGVMVGRGCYGKPWLLAQIMEDWRTGHEPPAPTVSDLYRIILSHWELMLTYYGKEAGMRIARKHLGWYSKSLPGCAAFRSAINGADSAEATRVLIDRFFDPLLSAEAPCL